MIELRQFSCFVAVAEDLHFARAAERLHIAQPALSMRIKALEEQLDVRLLDRSKRSVSLTAAGALFLEEARSTLRQAEQAEVIGRLAGRGDRGRIAIGYSSSAPFTGALSAILRRFRAAYPAVELSLSELAGSELAERLNDGRLDFGFCRHGYMPNSRGLNVVPMANEGFEVVMARTHRLAARDRIAVIDLAEEHFISYEAPGGSALMSPAKEICRRAGFEPHIAQSVLQVTTVVSLAAAGLGVAIVPYSLSQLQIPDAVFRPLDVEDRSTLVFACRRNERAPATMALIREAKRYIAMQPPMQRAARVAAE
ncbi:MAG: LysR substrate-binding domain-containing protein [Aliidongia sp.]